MKEAIRMVLESIYDPEFPDTSHFRKASGQGCHSVLRRIKEEWGISRWFLEFDIRKCFIDRHRLIQILKEEIDDPKFFYSIQKVFSAGRLVGVERGPYSVPHSVLLSALPGNIYLHKLDQEIGRIRQKYEIPIVQRVRSVLLRTGRRRDDQESPGCAEEASFNVSTALTQDNRAIRVKQCAALKHGSSMQRSAAFHSLVSKQSWHTLPTSTLLLWLRGDQIRPIVPSSVLKQCAALAVFLCKPSSLLSAAFPCFAHCFTAAHGVTQHTALKACFAHCFEDYGGAAHRCSNNWAMRDLLKYCKRKGPLIELGKAWEAILVIRSERGMARKQAPSHYLIRICYARYADDLLLGIVGKAAVELLIEIQKRIAHFLQSGLNLWVGKASAGSTTIAARSTVEFLGTVIQSREVQHCALQSTALRTTPIQFLRELEKRLRVKHRIHITACHLRSAIHSKFRNLGDSIPIKQLIASLGCAKTGSLQDCAGLAETLGTAGVRSPQVSVLWGAVKHIRQGSRGVLISFLHSSVLAQCWSNASSDQVLTKQCAKAVLWEESKSRGVHRCFAGSISKASEDPIQIEAPIKKILRRLRDRGIISQSRRRPWPIHVACLTNVSDEDIVNWSAGIAISPLSYYRCRDNLYQVRTIVDHQIRWSAIFTLAHKHKSSARNIIPKYSKDSKIVEGGKILAEFPNSIELGKLGPGT